MNKKAQKSKAQTKCKIPLSFILIVCGVILLQVNWMPFIGWLYVFLSFISGFVSLSAQTSKKASKVGLFFLIIIMIFLVGMMIFLSLPEIQAAFFKTFTDVQNLIGLFA